MHDKQTTPLSTDLPSESDGPLTLILSPGGERKSARHVFGRGYDLLSMNRVELTRSLFWRDGWRGKQASSLLLRTSDLTGRMPVSPSTAPAPARGGSWSQCAPKWSGGYP